MLGQFRLLFALTLLFRLWLAWALPMTGDESYFVLWGRHPDWGFYDHPPMVGWWLAGLLSISDAPLWLRMPAVVLPALLAWAALRLLAADWGLERARMVALVIVLLPANVWNVLITTDTPLVLFGVLAALFFCRAYVRESWSAYFWCGLCFAAAALSKYFVALLGLAMLVATLWAPTRRRFAGLGLIGLLLVPAVWLMVAWNAENCWPNILFNLVKRNEAAGFRWQQPAAYGLTLAYLFGFWPLWLMARNAAWPKDTAGKGLASLAIVPLVLFGLLSLSKTIGMHWLLAFVPVSILPLLRSIELRTGERILRWLGGLALVHAVAFVVLAALPLATWQGLQRYAEVVWTVHTDEVVRAAGLAELDGRVWMTDGYTYSAELSYARDRLLGRKTVLQGNSGDHVGVFGEGSHYARQDDRLTDFRALDGRSLGIVLRSEPRIEEFSPFFESLKMEPFTVRGAQFYRVMGEGFRYTTYRDQILSAVRARFYRFPPWLPDCGCFFDRRYFPE